MAPTKTRNKSKQEIEKIVNNLIKAIKKAADGQKDKDVCEVKVEVSQIGHGARPFGNYLPNDYIDFEIKVVGEYNHTEYKESGLGKYDINDIANGLKNVKGYEIENADLYFSYGNFTPDMVFPSYFRKFKKPCKEFNQLTKLVAKKYGIELKVTTLKIYDKYMAYDSNACQKEIDYIKSFGKKPTMCAVTNDRYGSELMVSLK